MERLDLSDVGTALQVLGVQRAAYQVEAELIGFDGIPPLHEVYGELVASSLTWIGIRIDRRVVAALAFRLEDGCCDIDRLAVAPEHAGKGLASALLARLLHHPRITVSTATANAPARRLYERHGFRFVCERPLVAGITATHYERRQ